MIVSDLMNRSAESVARCRPDLDESVAEDAENRLRANAYLALKNISCEFRDGVLTIHIPKMAPAGTRGRRIPIGEGSAQPSGQTGGTQGAIGTSATSGATAAPAATGAGNGRTTSRQTATAGTKGGQAGAKRGKA